jgi:hypothetical protein
VRGAAQIIFGLRQGVKKAHEVRLGEIIGLLDKGAPVCCGRIEQRALAGDSGDQQIAQVRQ